MSKVLLVLVLILGGAAAYVATRPDTYHVERSATVDAPPATVFAQIDDFSVWKEWSPWEKKDPAMKRTLGATSSGVGATYAWEGNKNVGTGRMEILQANAPSKLVIKLDFFKPFEAHNTAEFTMLPQGGATDVTWVMHGPASFVSRMMQVFMNLDRMIGRDFEAGLANLKKAAEQ